jgi:hypothetical protein
VKAPRLSLGRSAWWSDLFGFAPSSAPRPGADPALARSAETLWVVRRQVVAGLIPVVAGVVGVAFAAQWGVTLLVVAAAVELALLSAIMLASSRLRERARESIISGGADFRMPVLARERERLLRPRLRRSLAGALEDLVQVAERWHSVLRQYRPVFNPRLVRATAPELRTIARLLRSCPARAAAVARVERLLTSGASPLYGHDPIELRVELAHILRDLEIDAAELPSVSTPEQHLPT